MRFLLLLPLLFTSCSNFDSEWRQNREAGGGRSAFPQRWEGEWKSQKHAGAGGALRCLLTKVDERQYRARFRASWLVFTSDQNVLLQTRRTGAALHLQGAHQISGFGGGLYRYRGKVNQSRFDATYDASYDSGIFTMRPAP